ncbi:hypothetical protein D3C73_1341550 [compost metagenome]
MGGTVRVCRSKREFNGIGNSDSRSIGGHPHVLAGARGKPVRSNVDPHVVISRLMDLLGGICAAVVSNLQRDIVASGSH